MKFLRKLISSKVLIGLAIMVVVSQFVSPEAMAQISGANENETLKAFAQLFSIFVNIFTFLSLVFLNYGGDLVGTAFLTAPEPMAAIRPMWVIIRNITNVLFVLVLLFLAFSNLFSSLGGGEGGSWTIKEKLPKVILALVAINFSLLGFKVVLDAVHIGTITIFSIPDNTLQAKNKNKLEDMLTAEVVVTQEGTVTYVPFYQAINELMCGEKDTWAGAEGNGVKAGLPDDCLFAVDPTATMEGKSDAARNLFLAFGIQFQKLQNLPSFAARLNDWSDVFTSVLFVSILSLAQVVALAAVFIALLIRMVVLWIAMVFSPLLIAGSIMGFGQGEGGKVSEMIMTSIVMPLKIAAAFAVSFLMMDTMMDIGGPSGDFIKTGASLSSFGSTGYGLLWSIATIVVFWKAAFWALEGGVGHEFIQKIQNGAEQAGGFVARAGTIDQELLPMPGGKKGDKASLSNYLSMPGKFQGEYNKKMAEKDTKAAESAGLIPKGTADTESEYRSAIAAENVNSMDINRLIEFLTENGAEQLRTNQAMAKLFFPKLTIAARNSLGTNNEEEFAAKVKDVDLVTLQKILTAAGGNSTAVNSIKNAGTKTKTDEKKQEESKTDQEYTIVNAETTDARKITINNGGKEVESFEKIDDVKTYYNKLDPETDKDLRGKITEKMETITAELEKKDADGNRKRKLIMKDDGTMDVENITT